MRSTPAEEADRHHEPEPRPVHRPERGEHPDGHAPPHRPDDQDAVVHRDPVTDIAT